MKKFLFATLMGALVALVGCQQNDELTGVENTLGKKVSVTANIKANAQSRVAMEYVTGEDGGSTIKVEWKDSGESFLMYDATDKTKVSTFTQTSGNQFEGTLPNESGSYYAEYGDDANLVNQDGTLNEDYVWMKAPVTDLTQSIEFEHQTTILKPNFFIEGEPVNASITQIVMDDANAFTITPHEQEDIFIFLPIYMGLSYPQGREFKFIVTIEDIEYVGTLTISQTMFPGIFYTAKIHLEEKTIPYVTFTADGVQGLKYDGTDLEYSTNGIDFSDLNAKEDPIIFGGDYKLYLRGVENWDGTIEDEIDRSISFTTDVPVACEGDIRTLINYATYKTVDTSNATFKLLFKNCAQLTSAPELPATSLAAECYQSMFSGCISLEVAPELPATTLAAGCYKMMFYDCTSLTVAPELSATTLTNYCYQSMFKGCTSLEEAPALTATTLAAGCYMMMFNGCTQLTSAPALPVTTLENSCYESMFNDCTSLTVAPTLPATTLAVSCYAGMFKGTSLTEAPALPATTLTKNCYSWMFQDCTSLTKAPELTATILTEECYLMMFSGCEKLKNITMLATDISATDCLYEWVKGVATTDGEFTKAASMDGLPTGDSGIPAGWEVVNKP